MGGTGRRCDVGRAQQLMPCPCMCWVPQLEAGVFLGGLPIQVALVTQWRLGLGAAGEVPGGGQRCCLG